jgi:histidinol-phosphate aminotransferase
MVSKDSVYNLANSGVRQLVPYVPGKPIEELERELGIGNIIKMASNENPLGPSAKVLSAIQNELPKLTLYPDGNGFNLKQALAQKYGVAAEQITLGNGSNELLELIARAFLAPGVEAMFSEHAFAVYPIVTQAVGATASIIPALNFGYDLEAMALNINTSSRVIFIANPNNPTGTFIEDADLEKFIQSLPTHCLCVLDEAYFEFVAHTDTFNAIDWVAKNPNVIITRTFSKAYGLAGLRVGYSISSPEIADILNRVRQPFNLNSLALTAAVAALKDSQYLSESISVNAKGMKQITEGFQALHLDWIPSKGNFVSVDLKRVAQPVYDALLRKGIIVRPIANYGLPNHLRVSIGTETENAFFLNALNDVLANV